MSCSGVLTLANEFETEALGRSLSAQLRPGDVIALSGALGAGKTTLARGVLSGLGFVGEAPSPSFSLVIAYEPPEVRLPLWHVDLYRIEDPEEIEELGLADARSDAVLLIEWPERMQRGLWSDRLQLGLEPTPDGGRCLTWTAPAAWEARWPPHRS